MLPKYLSAGCGITVERRYHNINPIIIISPAGELIGYRIQDAKGCEQRGRNPKPGHTGSKKSA